MKKIYAIRNDGIKFKELDLNTMDVVNNAPDDIVMSDIIGFHRSNTSMKSWWKTPETKFTNIDGGPSGSNPDVSLWTGGAGSSLVFSPKAYRILNELLQSSGEFLPVKIGDETYHIFNCFILGEADEDKSEYEYVDGVEFGLKYLVFKESATEHLVFKSTFQGCLTLFCGDRFKNAVEGFGLQGIIFDTNLIQIFD